MGIEGGNEGSPRRPLNFGNTKNRNADKSTKRQRYLDKTKDEKMNTQTNRKTDEQMTWSHTNAVKFAKLPVNESLPPVVDVAFEPGFDRRHPSAAGSLLLFLKRILEEKKKEVEVMKKRERKKEERERERKNDPGSMRLVQKDHQSHGRTPGSRRRSKYESHFMQISILRKRAYLNKAFLNGLSK